MNKLQMSLNNALNGIDVTPRLEDAILRGQFRKEHRPFRMMPVAATICVCAILFWSISLLPLFSHDNPQPSTTNTSTTGTTCVDHLTPTAYRPIVQNLPDRTRSGFGTLTGHMDWDDQPDTVNIYPDPASEGPNGYSQVVIEVTLGNGRKVSYLCKDQTGTIQNLARADLFDVDNDGAENLILLYEMDYDAYEVYPLRILTLQVNTLVENQMWGYAQYIMLEDDYSYSFTGPYDYEKRPVPEAIRDELFEENGEIVNPLYGYSAIHGYELIEMEGGTKSLRVYQDVWAGESRYHLGVGTSEVEWDFFDYTYRYGLPTFIPADIEVTFPTAVLGTKPPSLGFAEDFQYEEKVKAYLEAWKNKDLEVLNSLLRINNLEHTEKLLQQIEISGYRYEPTEEERVFYVYLDIESSNLKGMPAGKNQKFSLVFDHDIIAEFTLIDPPPLAPVRGVAINHYNDSRYRKNELYYNAYRLLSSGYIELTSGPIAIDMSKNHYTKYSDMNGYNLVDIFPYLFSKEIRNKEPIPVDALMAKFEKICRIKNFDPQKLHRYSGSTNTVTTDSGYGLGYLQMNLTHVKQEGDVYICSFDLFDDPFCTVVTRSLDITMRDNGDGSYFFDRMDITYTSDISIVTRRPGVDPFP